MIDFDQADKDYLIAHGWKELSNRMWWHEALKLVFSLDEAVRYQKEKNHTEDKPCQKTT